ncbi:MAG: hypothetical protein ABH860_04300 [bacterium]
MAYGSVNPVSSSSNTAQIFSMNNNEIITQLLNSQDNPKFATVLLNQITSNNMNSILFGTENDTTSSSSNIDFGVSGLTGTTNINDVFGASAFSNISPQFELSVYSSLIGRTVTAKDPSSGKDITGQVKSVLLESGKAMLDIDGVTVPTENLSRVQ